MHCILILHKILPATTSIGHSGRLEIEGRVRLRLRLRRRPRHRRVPLGKNPQCREESEIEREKMRLLLKNAAQVLQVVDDRRSFLRGEREMKNLALIENGSIVVDAE